MISVLGIKAALSDLIENPQALVDQIENAFKQKTRKEWTQIFLRKIITFYRTFNTVIFSDEDACVTPVLDHDEVGNLPHHRYRQTFTKTDSKWIPAPAPRIYSAKEFSQVLENDKKLNSKL